MNWQGMTNNQQKLRNKMKHTKVTKKQAFKIVKDYENTASSVYVGLNEKGRAKLRAFIRKHWKNDIVRSRAFDFNGFYNSLKCWGYFLGHTISFEIGQFVEQLTQPRMFVF